MSELEPAVVASDLTASYGLRPVWTGGTFAIPSGSFTAILGPNGAGKSTLIRLILGQLSPSGGSLEVLGARPRRGNPEIGYVPQGSAFDAELSIRGRDFVGLGLDGHRWGVRLLGRARAAAVVSASIDAVGAARARAACTNGAGAGYAYPGAARAPRMSHEARNMMT